MRTVDEYTALITSWLSSKPNFVSTIRAVVTPFAALQDFLNGVPNTFDIDSAIGVQLDQLGLWIGLSRVVETPLTNIYFTWGSATLGWGQGVWQGPFDPSDGRSNLDDETYRTMLRAKIASNQWDGTIGTMAAALAPILQDYPNSLLFILDNQDMTMSVGVSGTPPPVIIQALLAGGYLPFKPAGVGYNFYLPGTPGTPVFGWGASGEYVAGWGTGSWGYTPTF